MAVNFVPRHVPRDERQAEHSCQDRPVAVETVPRRGGHAPYGWRWQGRQLVEDQHEQHVRWLILHMNRQGYSLARIAGELLSLNLSTRDGGVTWPRTTLHRVVSSARALEHTG